jgi:hypothetical protein
VATFDDVRRICLALPETEESTSYGTPAFKVKGKLFVRLRDDDGLVVCFVADLGEKELLLESDPDKFRTTPHYDGYPTVLLHLPSFDRAELAELLTDSWRQKAPAKVLAAFEAAGGGPPTP